MLTFDDEITVGGVATGLRMTNPGAGTEAIADRGYTIASKDTGRIRVEDKRIINCQADVNQFHAAGGMAYVIGELLDAGLLHPDVLTVAGQGLAFTHSAMSGLSAVVLGIIALAVYDFWLKYARGPKRILLPLAAGGLFLAGVGPAWIIGGAVRMGGAASAARSRRRRSSRGSSSSTTC